MRIPADFPRESHPASVQGVQPKIAVGRDGERYITGLTEDELRERYEACEDLAQQLATYCTRKAAEHPDWTVEFNIERTARGLARKVSAGEWDVSVAEQQWLMTRVREKFQRRNFF